MTPAPRNPRGVFITGTDTGVGKTIVTAAIAVAFASQGVKAGTMKPIETGLAESQIGLSDSDWLLSITNTGDARDLVAPYRFQLPASPLVAATPTGVKIDPDRIAKAFQTLSVGHDIVVVEGIGGVLVPITPDLFVTDLIKRLGVPTLIVARPGVGSINHTLLTMECLRARGVPILGLIFNAANRPSPGHDQSETIPIILRLSGARSFGELPFCDGLPATWEKHRATLISHLDVKGLLEALGLRAMA